MRKWRKKNYRENVLYRDDAARTDFHIELFATKFTRELKRRKAKKKIFTMFFLSPSEQPTFSVLQWKHGRGKLSHCVFHSKRDFSSERTRESWERKTRKLRGKTDIFTCSCEREQVKSSQVRPQHFSHAYRVQCIHQLIKNSRQENEVNKPNEFVEFSIHLRCDWAAIEKIEKNSHRSRRTQFLTLSLLESC